MQSDIEPVPRKRHVGWMTTLGCLGIDVRYWQLSLPNKALKKDSACSVSGH